MNIRALIEDSSRPEVSARLRDSLKESSSDQSFESFLTGLQLLFGPISAADLQPQEALRFAQTIATLGMNPHPAMGHVYIVKGKKGYVLYEGYKFRLYLLFRKGWSVYTQTVNEGEDCLIVYENDRLEIKHMINLGKRNPGVIASYAIAEKQTNGGVQRYIGFCDNNQLNRLMGQNKYPWELGPEAMAKKAAVHRLRHVMPIEALGLAPNAVEALEQIDPESNEILSNKGALTTAAAPETLADLNEFYSNFKISSIDIDRIENEMGGDVEAIKEYVERNFSRK